MGADRRRGRAAARRRCAAVCAARAAASCCWPGAPRCPTAGTCAAVDVHAAAADSQVRVFAVPPQAGRAARARSSTGFLEALTSDDPELRDGAAST